MITDRDSVGDAHKTGQSPVYSLFSEATVTALAVGTILMLLTVVGMLAIADSALARAGMVVFSIPLVGAIVFGILLTGGRYLGLRGIGNDNYPLAVAGSLLSVATYAWFGGIVLTPYDPSLYEPALAITGAITVALSLVAAAYVYTTDKDLAQWATYSAACFLGGLGALAIGIVFPPLLAVGFGLFLLGFLCDLVYEIWMTSNRNRSPAANGLALYIAFAGVFVHILQLVLRILSRSR